VIVTVARSVKVISLSLRVFDVPSYDMVLGMDWLQSLPLMWVDWTRKTIRYRLDGHRVHLRGGKAQHPKL
jgi:hypothetical protein